MIFGQHGDLPVFVDKQCSRTAAVGGVDPVPVEKGGCACCARILVVGDVVDEGLVYANVSVTQEVKHPFISLRIVVLHALLNGDRQCELDEVRGFTPVRPVAVADTKYMQSRLRLHVGCQNERIGVDFILIAR